MWHITDAIDLVTGATSSVYNTVKGGIESFFHYFNLLPKDSRIIFLGLDNAGKSTLLNMMHFNKLKVMEPTFQPKASEFTINNRHFSAHDLGGHEGARRLWKDYINNIDAVVFLVDAADRTRLEEARVELGRLFDLLSNIHSGGEDIKERLIQERRQQYRDTSDVDSPIPIIILGNKIDKPIACSEEELRHALSLPQINQYAYNNSSNKSLFQEHNRDEKYPGLVFELFMCSIAQREGYENGFQWLVKILNQSTSNRREKKSESINYSINNEF